MSAKSKMLRYREADMNCSPYLLKPLRELGDVMGKKHSHHSDISFEVESGHEEGEETV